MNSKIVRAWKDEFYRQSLSDEERAQLPENPVGELELTDVELGGVFAAGGHDYSNRVECHHYNSYDGGCYSYRPWECHHEQSRDWESCRSHSLNCNHYSSNYECRTFRTEEHR